MISHFEYRRPFLDFVQNMCSARLAQIRSDLEEAFDDAPSCIERLGGVKQCIVQYHCGVAVICESRDHRITVNQENGVVVVGVSDFGAIQSHGVVCDPCWEKFIPGKLRVSAQNRTERNWIVDL